MGAVDLVKQREAAKEELTALVKSLEKARNAQAKQPDAYQKAALALADFCLVNKDRLTLKDTLSSWEDA
jgi:hypothetical protein